MSRPSDDVTKLHKNIKTRPIIQLRDFMNLPNRMFLFINCSLSAVLTSLFHKVLWVTNITQMGCMWPACCHFDKPAVDKLLAEHARFTGFFFFLKYITYQYAKKSNKMHLNCLLYHWIPPTRFGQCQQKHVGGIQWYNKQFKCILLDFFAYWWQKMHGQTRIKIYHLCIKNGNGHKIITAHTLKQRSSQAHPLYIQQFLSVYFSKHVAQHQISWLTMTYKHQWFWHAWSHSNMDPLNQNASKQKLRNNKNVCFTHISSFANAAQITSETYN
jgi:hypothetical protein